MVPQVAETAESDQQGSVGLSTCSRSDRRTASAGGWQLLVRVFAVTLLCSGLASAAPQTATADRVSADDIGIEIIPRGAAWKAPAKAKPLQTRRPSAVQGKPTAPGPKSTLAGRSRKSAAPTSAFQEPQSFQLHSQAAANAAAQITETVDDINTAEAVDEPERPADPVPARPAVVERAEPLIPHNRTPQVATQDTAVPLIRLVEPPAYVRAARKTAEASVTASAPTVSPELWKPLRPEEQAEPLVRNPSLTGTAPVVADYGGNSTKTVPPEASRLAHSREPVEPSTDSAEMRVTAPEPRRPDVRKSAPGVSTPRLPGASHSLFATRRPGPPHGTPPVATVSRAEVAGAGHVSARPPQASPIHAPGRPVNTASRPAANLAGGRYGVLPNPQVPGQLTPPPAPNSRYGLPSGSMAHRDARAAAPASYERGPATAATPARTASHSIMQPPGPPRPPR